MIGDGALHPGKYNMAMIRRAIENGWPVKPEIRQLVTNQMALVVGKSDNERNKIAAARVLVAADGVNVRREAIDAADERPNIDTVNVQVNVGQNIERAQDDPEYLEFLRVRRLAGHSDAGPVCGDGEQGPLAHGQAPADPGPGHNGHAHGNGRH